MIARMVTMSKSSSATYGQLKVRKVGKAMRGRKVGKVTKVKRVGRDMRGRKAIGRAMRGRRGGKAMRKRKEQRQTRMGHLWTRMGHPRGTRRETQQPKKDLKMLWRLKRKKKQP